MAVSPDQVKTAINDYGPMAQIISAVPDLQRIISDALTQQMSADAFKAAVQASPWYQTHGQAVRNLIMTQAADPAEYQRQIQNAAMHVQQAANQLGRQLNPGDAGNLAFRYLAEGMDDKTLQDTIGGTFGVAHAGGAYSGQAGEIQGHVQQVAQSYGVAYTDQYVNDWANRIQSGQDSLTGFDAQMRARAKMQYPQFATQIDAGQTMVQIADPYMAQMAKTLEIPQTQVTLNDPYIQKALSQRDPSGAVTSQPLWAFNQTLKADPRYDKTVQAKTDAYATLNQVGKDFGFSSGTTGGTTSA